MTTENITCGSNPGTNSDTESQFVYDGLGRLRERIDYMAGCGGGDWCWQATNEVFYIYDGMRVIQERNGNNTPTVSFTRGIDLSGTIEGAGGIGGLLARSIGGNFNYYYHADGNGNIMCLESTAQTLVQSCRYDPFGNQTSGSFMEFGFSSKEWFGNGGQYYYGYRWYSPALQRWLNRDPIQEAGGINLYGFCRNDPIDFLDPYGLAWFDDLANWAQSQNAQFKEGMNATAGDENSWGTAGALNTVSDLAAGILSFPQAISQLGTGTGNFSANPTLANSAGVFQDVSTAASVMAIGLAPLPIGNATIGLKGGEITLTRPGTATPDLRINPCGGSGYPPHYHRRPGIGKHRPWEGGF